LRDELDDLQRVAEERRAKLAGKQWDPHDPDRPLAPNEYRDSDGKWRRILDLKVTPYKPPRVMTKLTVDKLKPDKSAKH
jgi:hypothetical protein